MPEANDERRKVSRPQMISWAIDGILAGALLAAVYQGGQFVERLHTVVDALESLSTRVSELEARPMGPAAAQRISVLESRADGLDRASREIKQDITARLDRLENKLDRALRL